MSARDDLIIRALPLGDQWNSYGADAGSGIVPTGVKLGVDDWGPHDIAFTLNRNPGVAYADLGASTPLEALIGDGDPLWTGRTSQSPTDEVNRAISVVGEGWQAQLDDDDLWKTYVHASMSDWGDIRSNPNAPLSLYTSVTQISNDPGGITLTVPGGTNATGRPASTGGAVVLDLGPNNAAVRVVVSWKHSNNAANTNLALVAANTIAGLTSGSTVTTLSGGTTPGTVGISLGGAFRFVALGIFDTSGAVVVPAADIWCQLTSILVVTSTAYEAGNVSILKASDVLKDLLPHAPLLSQDTSAIATTAFAIPDLAMTGYQTPRQLATAVNAYHAYQIRVRADKVLEFRPRPAYPLLTNIKGTFQDTSAGSLAQVYNRCAGLATGPDGVQIVSNQVPSPDTTIPGRRGYTRTNALDTNMSLTQTALDQLCQTFIASHGRMPFQGTLTVVGWDSVAFTVGGAAVAAWELLRYVGEMIHFPNLVDPDTGAKGRDGRIAAVSYDHDTRTSSVAIDSQLANFEALLARLQIVTGRVA